MEAPEKIYLPTLLAANAVGFKVDGGIECTRTDTFIEKACKFLSNKANIPLWEGYAHTFGCDTTKLVDEFRKYMKRE